MVEKPLVKEAEIRPVEAGRSIEVEKAVKEQEGAGEEGELTNEQNQEIAQLEQKAQAAAPAPVQEVIQKDQGLLDIEGILSNDLSDIYSGLSDRKKAELKVKGEEVAMNIQKMIRSGRIQVKKILDWIREWLRIIPGINKFFLEQEAKIKEDQIVEYIEEQKK